MKLHNCFNCNLLQCFVIGISSIFIFFLFILHLMLFSADGMLFGALARCPVCSGHLCFSEGKYKCHGYLSAWSKCSYSTIEPNRVNGKWKIPEETKNEYLLKVYELINTNT